MMHQGQKQIIYEASNCGEALQIIFLSKRKKKLLYYRVKIQEGTSIKTVYLNHREATFALKFEPWILDTANSLSQVHGYHKITFGDGATLKTENTV